MKYGHYRHFEWREFASGLTSILVEKILLAKVCRWTKKLWRLCFILSFIGDCFSCCFTLLRLRVSFYVFAFAHVIIAVGLCLFIYFFWYAF